MAHEWNCTKSIIKHQPQHTKGLHALVIEQSLQSPLQICVTLTPKEKLNLLDKLKKPGLSVWINAGENAAHYVILNRMKNSEDSVKVQLEWETVTGSSKRMRESSLPDTYEALLQSFISARNCCAVVSGLMFKAKADDFAKNLGYNEWK